MQTKSISYNNSLIHYKLTGKGQPVLLLHGFAEDSRIWDGFIDELEKDYLLVIPDIPGSGQSALLAGSNISMENYADVMNAILEEENISKAVFIGHSMGGYISLAFAKKYPGKINALGLFHSSAYADDDAKKETRQKAIHVINEKGPLAFLKTAIPGLFANAENSKAHINDLLEKASTFSNQSLVQYYQAMIARPDTTEVLKNIQQLVLFILGQHDKAVPFDHGLQQSHLPATAHIHILRNSAHMGMLEEKEASFKVLAHFLLAVYV